MSLKDIHSNAFNFSSFLSSGVDPRTGQYNADLNVISLSPTNEDEATYPVSLSFSTFNASNLGFGTGWKMLPTSLDLRRRIFTNSQGERYKCQNLIIGTEVVFLDKKIKNFRVLYVNNNTVRVYYKNGIIETLQQVNISSGMFIVTSVAFQNGEVYDFSYRHLIAGQPCLTEIHRRQSNVLMLRLSYSGVNCHLIQYPDDNGSMLQINLVHRNNLLTSISLPYAQGAQAVASFTLSYITLQNEFLCIQEFKTPAGATEVIQYNATGLRVTMQGTLPCVTTTSLNPGNGQPSIVKSWQYSQNTNFTGFSSGRTHIDPEQDNLYLVTGNYFYSSTETLLLNSAPASSTTRQFNRFHLLVSEETVCDGKKVSKQYVYNELPGLNYYQQPLNLPLPAEITVTYQDMATGRSRQEKTTYITDDWGNTLSVTHPDGIRERNEYYSAAGQSGQCPADPLGFSRFIRSCTKSPAYGQAKAKVTNYYWHDLPSIPNDLNFRYVCLSREEINGELTRRYTYNNAINTTTHSLISRIDVIKSNITTTTSLSYKISNSTLEVTETTIGHDGSKSSKTSNTSRFTQHLLASTDENGVLSSYIYNPEGKLAVKNITDSSTNTNRHQYRYTYPTATSTTTWPTMTETDSGGVKRTYEYDGLGRVCRILEQDDDAPNNVSHYSGTMREVQTSTYNALGQLSSETEIDWLWDLNPGTPRRLATPVRIVKNYTYDGWGNRTTTRYNNGREEFEIDDPVTNTTRQGLTGESVILTQKNAFDEPESISLLNTNNTVYATLKNSYDGFGRKITETNHVGAVTSFEYDNFDRLVQKTLPEGTVLTQTYASFSDQKNIASISIQGKTYATAKYDGILRSNEEVCGGRKTTFSYNGGKQFPETFLTADNKNHTRKYEYHLGRVVNHSESESLLQKYHYDNNTGKLLGATEDSLRKSFSYYPSGLVREENTTGIQSLTSKNQYRYSMRGRPQTVLDSKNKEHRYEYDSFGRIILSIQDRQEVTFEYDKQSRVVTMTTGQRGQSSNLVTTISYDSFGREVRRIFKTSTATTTLTLTYTPEGKIKTRELRDNRLIRKEEFEYDVNSRLSNYRCSGVDLPVDHKGRALSGQRFTYDRYGNIATMESIHANVTTLTQYEYDSVDPCQLIAISEGNQRIVLQYDRKGNLTRDEKGQHLIYDAKNRLREVRSPNNQLICRYHYDSQDILIAQEMANTAGMNRYYYAGENTLNADINGKQLTWISDGSGRRYGHSEQDSSGEKYHSYGLMLDNTPCLSQSDSQTTHHAYTPFGFRSLLSSSPGLSGAQVDPVTGWYFLGNGYRVFNPVLMRFHSPDNWSPFGEGGINPYIYALNDPINNIDPSGHLSTEAIIGITLSAIGLLLSILSLGAAIPAVAAKSAALASIAVSSKLGAVSAVGSVVTNTAYLASSATSESNPQASHVLSMIGLGATIFTFGVGVASTVSSVVSNVRQIAQLPASTHAYSLGKFTSSISGSSPLDMFMLGSEMTMGAAYIGVSFAAEFVDEETASQLGIAGLALTAGGLAMGVTSMFRTVLRRHHIYEPRVQENIIGLHTNVRSTQNGSGVISTRL